MEIEKRSGRRSLCVRTRVCACILVQTLHDAKPEDRKA